MFSRLLGLGLAATGAAHFASPQTFEAMTAPLFPDDTDEWIKRNGAAELAIGLLILNSGTRKLGYLGLVAHGAHIAFRMVDADEGSAEADG